MLLGLRNPSSKEGDTHSRRMRNDQMDRIEGKEMGAENEFRTIVYKSSTAIVSIESIRLAFNALPLEPSLDA